MPERESHITAVNEPADHSETANENQLRVLGKLLVGAVTEVEAGAELDLPVTEMRRLRNEFADAILMPISANLKTQRFELLDLRGARFDEPFLRDTIERVKQENPNLLNLQIDLLDFVRAAQRYEHPPDAFLFHVGRCGSTLLANMLSASGEHQIVKEPDLLNNLIVEWLFAPNEAAGREIKLLLGAAIRYLLGTSSAIGAEYGTRYSVLKFSSWNTCVGGTVLELFPETPAVFLYRSPIETVASLFFQNPFWLNLIKEPRRIQCQFFPSLHEAPEALTPITLFAHAWRSVSEAALALPANRLQVIDYKQLIGDSEATLANLLLYFRHSIRDAKRLRASLARTQTYSKDPSHSARFDPDGKHNRTPLTNDQAEEVLAITSDVWRRLNNRACLNDSESNPA
jgi:hypothetical protein